LTNWYYYYVLLFVYYVKIFIRILRFRKPLQFCSANKQFAIAALKYEIWWAVQIMKVNIDFIARVVLLTFHVPFQQVTTPTGHNVVLSFTRGRYAILMRLYLTNKHPRASLSFLSKYFTLLENLWEILN